MQGGTFCKKGLPGHSSKTLRFYNGFSMNWFFIALSCAFLTACCDATSKRIMQEHDEWVTGTIILGLASLILLPVFLSLDLKPVSFESGRLNGDSSPTGDTGLLPFSFCYPYGGTVADRPVTGLYAGAHYSDLRIAPGREYQLEGGIRDRSGHAWRLCAQCRSDDPESPGSHQGIVLKPRVS